MKDGIIKADGTSRLARSVADFKSKYPTYDAFASALVAGTLPLDILFNEAGWAQLPDFLNKANLLKDGTAVLYGLDGASVPDDVFVSIMEKVAGNATIHVLWENASPASNFSAQTVNVNLANYELVFIEFTVGSGVSIAVALKSSGTVCLGGVDGDKTVGRTATISDTSIVFTYGYYSGWNYTKQAVIWTEDASRCKPVRIYGIKEVRV